MSSRFQEMKDRTARALLEGPGTLPSALRQAIARGEPPEDLRPLVDKVRRHAYKVTDEDVAALKERYSEDQLFEIIVAAAFGAAEKRLQAGLLALEQA
jgi:hypothetical protein